MLYTIKLLTAFLLVTLFFSCETGYVAEEPIYVENARPIAPYPNYIWIGDGWQYRRGIHNYQRTPGHWAAPRAGHNYQQGHWSHDNRGNHWNGGRWR